MFARCILVVLSRTYLVGQLLRQQRRRRAKRLTFINCLIDLIVWGSRFCRTFLTFRQAFRRLRAFLQQNGNTGSENTHKKIIFTIFSTNFKWSSVQQGDYCSCKTLKFNILPVNSKSWNFTILLNALASSQRTTLLSSGLLQKCE